MSRGRRRLTLPKRDIATTMTTIRAKGGATMRMGFQMNSIRFMASLAAALVMAGSAWAAEPLKVGKSVPQAFGFVPLDIGVRNGIFQKNGVEIEILNFGGAPRLNEALTAGSVDLGLHSGADMVLITKGMPTMAVAAMAGPPLELTIFAGAGSGIEKPADLKGKKLSVSSITSLTGWLAAEFSRLQGWGPKGMELVQTGQVSASIAALAVHNIDALSIDVGTALFMQRQGKGRLMVKYGDYITDFHQYVISATNELIAERPDAVRGFLKGWFATIDFMAANKDNAVAIAADVQHVDPDIAAETYEVMMRTFSRDGRFQPKALATLRRSFVELGLAETEPDMAKLYTEAYLPQR
jgi:NitT/TauT family transport system substrate-binding protein